MLLGEDFIKHFLVVDLEATCDDTNDGTSDFARSEMETIEIGAVMVNATSLKVVDEFQAFVRPIIHTELRDFCKNLTSIQQADVDAADTFPSVFNAFLLWASQFEDYLFCSWGKYDSKQLEQDCSLHNIPFPLNTHFNIKLAFSAAQDTKKRFGLDQALNKLNLELEGTHHRGIDDARNIAKILPYINVEQPINR